MGERPVAQRLTTDLVGVAVRCLSTTEPHRRPIWRRGLEIHLPGRAGPGLY
jgi:hypothetical protein